jgi:hypothetical protein
LTLFGALDGLRLSRRGDCAALVSGREGLYEFLGICQIALCGRKVNVRRFHSITSGHGADDLLMFFWL